ncbi:MAG: phosphotransferase family protein [Pseudomonadota bacterium]
MKTGKAFDDALSQWLNQHWRGVEDVSLEGQSQSPQGSGFSATTLIIPISCTREGRREHDRVVVRIESDEPPVYPQQSNHFAVEIELQYRAMEILSDRPGVPIAPLIGYEDDPDVLGAPFFAMGFIDGEVPIEHPIYTAEGFFVEANPTQRASMIESGLEVLATLHSLDWQLAGVEWLIEGEPGISRQMEIWQRFTERELAGRIHPTINAAYEWLSANVPQTRDLALNWGDARLGNIIWQDYRCACICDFENIAVAPAAMDVGWWLMFDRYAHEAQGIERLSGELNRDQQKAYYEQCSGRSLGDTYFHELFAGVRYAAMVVRVMNRWVERGDLPEDQTIWLENPVASMLADMLEERPR